MKKAVLLAASLVSLNAFAVEFDLVPGCVWKRHEARCVVQNRLDRDIMCRVSITGETSRGIMVGNSRQLLIPARKFNDSIELYTVKNDPLKDVSSFATCRVLAS